MFRKIFASTPSSLISPPPTNLEKMPKVIDDLAPPKTGIEHDFVKNPPMPTVIHTGLIDNKMIKEPEIKPPMSSRRKLFKLGFKPPKDLGGISQHTSNPQPR